MDHSQLLQHFDTLAETPDAVAKLRALVRDLAIRGRLVPQEAKDDQFTGELASKNAGKKMQNIYSLPQKWKWLLLSQLAVLIRGVSYRKDQATKSPEPGYVPVLRASNIGKGLNFDDLVYVPRANVAAEQLIKRDDVLIAMSSGSKDLVGKAAQAESDFEGGFGAFCGLIRLVVKLHPEYFGLFLETPFYRERIAAAGKGIGINNLQKESLESLPIPIPPLAEQRRIVAKVEELLAWCDELEARQTAAREHRTRLVSSALDHLTTAKDESLFKKHSAFCLQHSELLFDSVSALRQAILSLAVQGRIAANAKTWPNEPESLGKFAPMQNGYAFESGWFVPKGVRLLRNKNVSHGVMQWDDMECIVGNRLKEFERFRLNEGDVVLSLDRPFISTGIKVARVRREDLPCLLLQRVGRFQPDAKRLHPDYLFLFLNSPRFAGQIDPGRSNGVPHISSKQVEAAEIFVPPLAEQQRIVAKVDELLRWCDALAARLTAARTTATHLLDATLHQILAA